MLVFALPAAVLLLCLILAIVARRGRTVDDHPLCRRCGFDLTGKPADSAACAECGADLSGPRAVRVGHRSPRRRLLATAVAGLALSAGWLGIAEYLSVAKVDWAAHKPTWWLVRDAKGRDAAARDAALAELAKRTAAGNLPDPQLDELADLGLAHQADRSAVWVPGWGVFVEAARTAGELSDERWARYRLQAGQLVFDVRPTVRRGDPLPFWLRDTPARLAAAQFVRSSSYGRSRRPRYDAPGDALAIDGKPVPEFRNDSSNTGPLSARSGGGATGRNIDLPPRLLGELADGLHEVTLRVRVAVGIGSAQVEDRDGPADPAVATEVVELRAPFTLVPADQPTVTVNPDPTLRPAVERSLTATNVRFDPGSNTRTSPQFNLTINHDGRSPVGLAYEAFARPAGAADGGLQWKLGTINFTAGRAGGYGTGAYGDAAAKFDADRIDLVLVPSVAAAVRTTNLTRIWGGEVVIRSVPVERVALAGGPASPATTPATAATSPPASRPATRSAIGPA